MRNYRVGRARLDGDTSKLHLEVAAPLVAPHSASAEVFELFNGTGDVSWQSLPPDSRCSVCDAYYTSQVAFLEI